MERIEPDFNPFADLSVTMVGVFFVLLSLLLLTITLSEKRRKAIRTEYIPIYVGSKDVDGKTLVFFTKGGGEIIPPQKLKFAMEGKPIKMKNFSLRYSFGTQGDINCSGFFPQKNAKIRRAEKGSGRLISLVKKYSHNHEPSRWRLSIFILDKEGLNYAAKFMRRAIEKGYIVSVAFHQKGWYYIYGCSVGSSIPILEF